MVLVWSSGSGLDQWFWSGPVDTRQLFSSLVQFLGGVSPPPHLFGRQDPLYDGDGVRGGLSRPGSGPSQKILPLQSQRDGLLLDEGGLRPAQVRHGLGQQDGR